jgi:hypothetical protein
MSIVRDVIHLRLRVSLLACSYSKPPFDHIPKPFGVATIKKKIRGRSLNLLANRQIVAICLPLKLIHLYLMQIHEQRLSIHLHHLHLSARGS